MSLFHGLRVGLVTAAVGSCVPLTHHAFCRPFTQCYVWYDQHDWWTGAGCDDQFEVWVEPCDSEFYEELPCDCDLSAYFDCLTVHASCVQGVAYLDPTACPLVCL